VCRRAAQASPLTKAWPARSRFGPRTCHDRRVTELTKLAFVWLASGARVSDDRQTTNRRMPDGIIVCFSFVLSGVRLAGTNSRRPAPAPPTGALAMAVCAAMARTGTHTVMRPAACGRRPWVQQRHRGAGGARGSLEQRRPTRTAVHLGCIPREAEPVQILPPLPAQARRCHGRRGRPPCPGSCTCARPSPWFLSAPPRPAAVGKPPLCSSTRARRCRPPASTPHLPDSPPTAAPRRRVGVPDA